jgi:uncharacterized protein (TIGR03435 family)
MKRTLARVSNIVLLSSLIWLVRVFGQSPETPPTFDVADVHTSKPGTTEWMANFLNAGRVEERGATMLNLITVAYQVENDRVIGGPPWLDTDRFDISAKAAPTTQQDTLRVMLQALLAERFTLVIRKEERPLPIFVLTVGKRGLNLKESAGDSASRCAVSGGPTEMPTTTCQHMTMAQLAQRLRGMSTGYIDDPVVDKTGLTGAYDFTLSFTQRFRLRKSTGGTTIFDAVDKQLGLKLEAQEQPGTVVLLEHVNQKPTDNPVELRRTLPPPPTEFEVAEIRPSKPGAPPGRYRFLQSGQVEFTGATLKRLITMAYGVEADRVVGAPKWWDSDHFDVIAKSPTWVPNDTLQPMLQKLLAERFKLAVHNDEQPVPVYGLTAGKRNVKLKEADGSARSSCKESTGDGTDIYTCQNTTMAQLAAKLRTVAPVYLDHPVVDLTGIKGSYDFTLIWTWKVQFVAGRGGGDSSQPPGGVAAATDPNGDTTVFEAVEKYLGLKLAPQKYPMPVVVIDHIEQKPTEN